MHLELVIRNIQDILQESRLFFYPKYGEHFSLYPDFERKMFEAKCRGRGRIRLGYMLVLAVSILKEKSVRTMIKNIVLG